MAQPLAEGADDNLIGTKPSEEVPRKAIRCSAVTGRLVVGCDGTVYPCNDLIYEQFALGNILRDRKETILESEITRDLLRRTVYSLKECLECDLKYFCDGLCAGEAYVQNKTIWSLDPKCSLIKRQLHKRMWTSVS